MAETDDYHSRAEARWRDGPVELDRTRARAALRRIEASPPELVVQLTTRELELLVQRAVDEAISRGTPPALPRYLTTREVGDMVGVRPDTVQKWHRRLGLPGYRIDRLLRFRRDEVERWLDGRAADPRSWTRQWADRAARMRES